MSQANTLDLPEWLAAAVRTRSTRIDQPIPVNRAWWTGRLGEAAFADELVEAPDGSLTRAQLFKLGARAGESPQDARRLLWATCAWGTGLRHRNNGSRVRSVKNRRDEVSELLQTAAETARTDARAAFMQLRPSRNAVPYLGPPFFTKFLYFAGGGGAAHPCLILDSLVAKSLRRECGWTELTGWYSWSADQYVDYCDLLARWAKELNDDGSDEAVRPDQFEYALFTRGRHS